MSNTATAPAFTPVVISIPRTALQLGVVTLLALFAYYMIGVDQGMTSIFGNTMGVHEFVHDARHFLGFPCH
jgi:hypothetical protein